MSKKERVFKVKVSGFIKVCAFNEEDAIYKVIMNCPFKVTAVSAKHIGYKNLPSLNEVQGIFKEKGDQK